MATQAEKPKFFPAMGGLFLVTVYLTFVVSLLCGGLWGLAGDQRCLKTWDARFHPEYVAGTCSILQRGLRVALPEYYNLESIRDPESRE